MSSIFRDKAFNFYSLIIFIISTFSYFISMSFFNSVLDVDFVVGYMKPFAVLSIGGVIFCITFLFIPPTIFHTWLRHIAWWYLPLLLFAILSTPIYSGNVLSFDRSQIAFGGVVLLALITLPYVGWRVWRR